MRNGLNRRNNNANNLSRRNGSFEPFFDSLFNELETSLNNSYENILSMDRNLKVYEEDGKVNYLVQVAGFNRDEITLELDEINNVLTVSAEQKDESDNRYLSRSFETSLNLDDNLDPDTLDAKLENGILHITIAYKQGQEGNNNFRSIEIK